MNVYFRPYDICGVPVSELNSLSELRTLTRVENSHNSLVLSELRTQTQVNSCSRSGGVCSEPRFHHCDSWPKSQLQLKQKTDSFVNLELKIKLIILISGQVVSFENHGSTIGRVRRVTHDQTHNSNWSICMNLELKLIFWWTLISGQVVSIANHGSTIVKGQGDTGAFHSWFTGHLVYRT